MPFKFALVYVLHDRGLEAASAHTQRTHTEVESTLYLRTPTTRGGMSWYGGQPVLLNNTPESDCGQCAASLAKSIDHPWQQLIGGAAKSCKARAYGDRSRHSKLPRWALSASFREVTRLVVVDLQASQRVRSLSVQAYMDKDRTVTVLQQSALDLGHVLPIGQARQLAVALSKVYFLRYGKSPDAGSARVAALYRAHRVLQGRIAACAAGRQRRS